ncbi:hypothetical protein HYFRA_00003364 [Hymenoscyphus fraxineus]|uniref:Uncharacterized protein n=1 Tax=Hymenoscyphus fraxineus TaxID=746836 RepID=A0A9N9PHK2_9HELO|nr:hypothetical protein HYFRA_00003364 [Hymenoscyphus fraxineus]
MTYPTMTDLLELYPQASKNGTSGEHRENNGFTVTSEGEYSVVRHRNIQFECIRRGLSTEGPLRDLFLRLDEDGKAKALELNTKGYERLVRGERKRKRVETDDEDEDEQTHLQSILSPSSRQLQARFLKDVANTPYIFIPFSAFALKPTDEELQTLCPLFRTFDARQVLVGHTGYIVRFKHHVGGDEYARRVRELLPQYITFKSGGLGKVAIKLSNPDEPEISMLPQPIHHETKKEREACFSDVPLLPIIGTRPYIVLHTSDPPTTEMIEELRKKLERSAPDFIKAGPDGDIYICYSANSDGERNMNLVMKRRFNEGLKCEDGEDIPAWMIESSIAIRASELEKEKEQLKPNRLPVPEASLPRLTWEVRDFLASMNNIDSEHLKKATEKVIDEKRNQREAAARKRLLQENPTYLAKLAMEKERKVEEEAAKKAAAEAKREVDKKKQKLEDAASHERTKKIMEVLRAKDVQLREKEVHYFNLEPESRREQHVTFYVGEMMRFG